MSDSELTGGGAPLPPNTFNPIMHAAYPPGTVVYATSGDATAALATAVGTCQVLGLTAHQSSAGERGLVQYTGLLTLETAQWDARVTGQSGGLTVGATYYVSDASAGKLVTTRPSGGAGHYVAPVGTAISPRTMLVKAGVGVVSGS